MQIDDQHVFCIYYQGLKKKKKICKLNTVRSTVDFNSPAGAEEVSLKAKNGLHNSGGHDRSSLVLNVSSEKRIKETILICSSNNRCHKPIITMTVSVFQVLCRQRWRVVHSIVADGRRSLCVSPPRSCRWLALEEKTLPSLSVSPSE